MTGEAKFKVGDRVRCVCYASMYHNHVGVITAPLKASLGVAWIVAGASGGWCEGNLAVAPCLEGNHNFDATTDVCAKCQLSRAEVIAKCHSCSIVAPAAPAADPYVTAARELTLQLARHGFDADTHPTPEAAVAALMKREDEAPDLWAGKASRRERLVAALALELAKPVGARFPPESRSCRVYRSNDR